MRSVYIVALLALASCNPIKRLERSEKARKAVERYMLSRGICKPDTFTVRRTDTLLRIDTIGEIIIYTDTAYVRDTVRITRDRLREVLKTLTIRDTLWQAIHDKAKEESLVVELSECRARTATYEKTKQVYKWAGLGMGLLILLSIIIAIKK
jgi:membrane carboxypeptidase/penicillin-binding protein